MEIKDIRPLVALAKRYVLDVDVMAELGNQYTTGAYYPTKSRIEVEGKLPLFEKIFILAHELGHALQAPQEFNRLINPTLEEKLEFVMDVETDAWDKAELLIQMAYSDIPTDFWYEYEKSKTKCLCSYNYIKLYPNRLDSLYVGTRDFIFIGHSNKKPIKKEFFENAL